MTRHSVDTPEGKAMLLRFAEAVRRMNDAAMPAGNPRSWRFQWYIHSTPRDKATLLQQAYGNGASPLKTIANEVWSSCQAHINGMDDNMFLPWHRMYLYAFEEIVRAVLGDASFALPYWDYTNKNSRAIPAAFRSPSGPTASLYRSNRNQGRVNINAGDPMDKGASGDPFGIGAMSRPDYGGVDGFCAMIDGYLHSNVHVGVGDPTNMGFVPTAAGDPIFWLHHCNIDRIWASWNAAGGENEYLNSRFAFAAPDPAGRRVEWAAGDVGTTEALGYAYDQLPTPPAGPLSTGASGGEPATVAISDPITLGSGETRVSLRPAAPPGDVITASVSSATATGHILVLFRGLSANAEPGVLYEAFLNLPANASPEQRREHYLGTFSFFGKSGEHAHHSTRGPSFDITDRLDALRKRGLFSDEANISIVPLGTAAEGAKPTIAAIEFVRR